MYFLYMRVTQSIDQLFFIPASSPEEALGRDDEGKLSAK